jgi:hypothetical protein
MGINFDALATPTAEVLYSQRKVSPREIHIAVRFRLQHPWYSLSDGKPGVKCNFNLFKLLVQELNHMLFEQKLT